MSVRSRLNRLEAKNHPQATPWLIIARSDCDVELDGIGFRDCPLQRKPGELWDDFEARVQQWAKVQSPPVAVVFVRYRDD